MGKPRFSNWSSKEDYNAYMREFMAEYRRKKRSTPLQLKNVSMKVKA